MTRSLAALCLGAALLGAPVPAQAGIIPWLYDSIFGYGHYGVGYGGGWGMPYGGGAYMTGYAPAYPASYGIAYGGNACCATTANYAPWTDSGYGYGGACCGSPGTICCNPCGTGCDPGCAACPGGNCGTGSSGTTTVPSTPSTPGTGSNPTYAPPTDSNIKTPPEDQFVPAQNRDNLGPGSSIPPAGGFGTPGSNVDPNNPNAPEFAPGQPSSPRPDRRNEDARTRPLTPLQPGEKVAFKIPARFSRTAMQPVFELPTIVSAPSRTPAEAPAAATAVAAK